jgi:D-sedoheptulose 7-phosphate isomerase
MSPESSAALDGTQPHTGHSPRYLAAAASIVAAIDPGQIDELAGALAAIRARGGRLFVLGVGGGAGHASHAVNDFRKLCAIEAYAPTDNVSELTARTNDDGWEMSFSGWLEVSRLCERDGLFVFSVGGGSRELGVSMNLVRAMEDARAAGAALYGVAGAPGGALGELADTAILLEPPPALRTPLVESLQALVWHALVSHPQLAVKAGHWESLTAGAGS